MAEPADFLIVAGGGIRFTVEGGVVAALSSICAPLS
jgi:hypothetical protein